MTEPFENIELLELSAWESLIQSDEWKVYINLCEEHKEYLKNMCLKSVSIADFHNAVRYQSKYEDVDKQISLMRERIKQLRDVKAGGKNG